MKKGVDMEKLRNVEDNYYALFSTEKVFNSAFKKMEDNIVYDKYDHNQFIPIGEIQAKDIDEAINYQKDKNLDFLKIDSRQKLDNDLVERYDLEESCTLTMVLEDEVHSWDENLELTFKDMKFEDFAEKLINIETKHFGEAYGEDFCRRNISQMIETAKSDARLHYFGAFLDNELVGSCFAFVENGYVMIDGLLVDEEHRHKLVATSLLKYIVTFFEDSKIFLHADEEDTPKEMYYKLGFDVYDELYEYYAKISA